MKKRILSLFLALVVTFSMVCPLVFADDSSTHVHNWTSGVISEFSDTVEGIPVSVSVKKCTECNFYKHTYKFFGLSFDFYSVTAYTGIVEDFLLDVSLHIMNSLGKNASAKKYETGGGSADGSSGVGRRPSGYVSDNGIPSVNTDGEFNILVYPDLGKSSSSYQQYPDISLNFNSVNYSASISGLSGSMKALVSSFTTSNPNARIYYRYRITAPVSGVYYIKSYQQTVSNILSSSTGELRSVGYQPGSASKTYSAGATATFVDGSYYFYVRPLGNGEKSSYSFSFHPITVTCIPDTPSFSKKATVTINQNVWNGNIYQDNSTSLTYIYPQYTTVNESNEYVTNISENPIIYNNETNEYYTYDSVTNNYYYITYVTESPTPTPSPDPTPTPDPGADPTPTPEPGENTGDTSGIMKILQEIKTVLVNGFAGITGKLDNISTPETAKPGSSSSDKEQSWWEKLLGKIGDAIVDGLLGAISAVLKLIFKLFTTILGWIIWLVSQVLTLFPFLPPGLGALLIGGVVVCFIIGLIKFIRG